MFNENEDFFKNYRGRYCQYLDVHLHGKKRLT